MNRKVETDRSSYLIEIPVMLDSIPCGQSAQHFKFSKISWYNIYGFIKTEGGLRQI